MQQDNPRVETVTCFLCGREMTWYIESPSKISVVPCLECLKGVTMDDAIKAIQRMLDAWLTNRKRGPAKGETG